MRKNNKFIVYADMNCPFCFALHERLLDLSLLDRVEWRPVEHAPGIRFDTNDLKALAELKEEVARVKEVAKDVNIRVPPGRPNSRLPIELIEAASRIDGVKSMVFRTLIYRALWESGEDISDPDIVDRLRIEAELPELDQHINAENTQQWQTEWEEGDFSRNIPVLVTENGNKLLGLPSSEVIKAFVSGSQQGVDFDEGAFCYLKPREKVLIASDSSAILDEFADTLREAYSIEFAQFGEAVYQSCISANPPDLVLMDTALDEPDGFMTCANIKDDEISQNIAIIMFSREKKIEYEVKAFDSGAADYISLPCAPEVLLARVRVLLRLKRTTDLLEQYSRLDGLTEIPNRREFDRVLDTEWRRAVRSREPLSLILLDVDFFKQYNDNYGHMEGDYCLKRVAELLEQSIRRPHDMVARYGGEEFVIVLPETSPEYAKHVAELIRQSVASLGIEHEFSQAANHITFSFGVSTSIPNRGESSKDLIDAADRALYEAKEKGRNCVVFEKCTNRKDAA